MLRTIITTVIFYGPHQRKCVRTIEKRYKKFTKYSLSVIYNEPYIHTLSMFPESNPIDLSCKGNLNAILMKQASLIYLNCYSHLWLFLMLLKTNFDQIRSDRFLISIIFSLISGQYIMFVFVTPLQVLF